MIEKIKELINNSTLSKEDKQELLDYIEDILDKAWKYTELNK